MKKRNAGSRSIWLIALLVTAVIAGILLVFVFRDGPVAEMGAVKRMVPEGLPTAEAEDWKKKEVDPEQFFIMLNTTLTMEEGKREANLSISNPPYSAYKFKFKITLKEGSSDRVLYQSKPVLPGTYYETVSFQTKLEPGRYEAVVDYTFYEEDEKAPIGEHSVPITIEVNES